MIAAGAALLVGALATGPAAFGQDAPSSGTAAFVAPAAESSLDGHYQLQFVPRYPDVVTGQKRRADDLRLLEAALATMADQDRRDTARALQARLKAVDHWAASFDSQRADPDLPVAQRARYAEQLDLLNMERLTLEEQLRMLGEAPAAQADPSDLAAVAKLPTKPRRRASDDAIAIGRGLIVDVRDHVVDAVAFGGPVTVRGVVDEDVVAFGGGVDVTSSAVVGGDVTAFGGDIVVQDGADVGGEVFAIGGGVERHDRNRPGATPDDVTPDDTDDIVASIPEAAATPGVLAIVTSWFVPFLMMAGVGILTVGLVPERVGRVADVVEMRPVASLATGVFGTFALLVGTVLFAITLIGVPVALLLVLLLASASVLGFVGICQAVGDRLPFADPTHGRWVALLVGTAIVTSTSFLPWLATAVVWVGGMLGVGAALATRLGRPSAR